MEDILKALKETPIPTLLIWAGLLFILLTFVSKLGGMIEVQPNQKRWTLFIGLLLLTIGLVLNFTPNFHQSNLEIPKNPNVSPTPVVSLPNGSLGDLEKLQMYLQKQDFQNANEETKVLLFKAANLPSTKERFDRGDSQQFDCQGLKSVDILWKDYSKNKFGLSVQKNILLDVQTWERFAEKVGWKRRDGKFLEDRSQLTYDISAPIGHLPGVLFWMTDKAKFYDGISCTL